MSQVQVALLSPNAQVYEVIFIEIILTHSVLFLYNKSCVDQRRSWPSQA